MVRARVLVALFAGVALAAMAVADVITKDQVAELNKRARELMADAKKAVGEFKPGEFKGTGKDALVLKYQLFTPAKSDKKLPLVVVLHGAGERGDDNEKQIKANPLPPGLWALPSNQEKHPCFVIAPQCPAKDWWGGPRADLVIGAIDELVKTQNIDPSRIYVTGLSMGGFGTFDLITRYPDKFAAALPMCGGMNTKLAGKIKSLPIWVFHGGDDKTVPTQKSRDAVEAITKAGGKPKYHELEGVGHNCWDDACATDGLVEWVFSQQRGH